MKSFVQCEGGVVTHRDVLPVCFQLDVSVVRRKLVARRYFLYDGKTY